MNGIIFDVKRFAVHDGEGLRSTLFLKGCPLRCPWCQNPEGIGPAPALWYNPAVCVGCGGCVGVCPAGALTLNGRVHADRTACTLCGKCVDLCPSGALSLCGRTVSAQAAAELLLRDRVFFGADGGVTLSGGEVLLQWEFSAEVLALCRAAGVRTAIETSMMGPRAAFEALLPVTDQFLTDIKIFNAEEHRRLLGADNRLILDNYRFLHQQGASVLTRTPLIPGYTDSEDNIRSIARFARSVNPDASYELLNFNPLCRSKYSALERDYPVQGGALTHRELERFYDILAQEGIVHIIKE
ncbi:MAG: glycyl-radical enzyme activating protein [Oscillospiraceae bacterium]|nr:glycyl-radical enzyme activating protein [Oscillospiraceae bacterium]